MQPLLRENDDVLAKPVSAKTRLALHDIIVFTLPQQNLILIKRITHLNGEQITVEGDNSDHSTDSRSFGEILRSQVLARVTSKLS